MHKRPCAGKPDGSPCSAPAVRGTDHCRHHQPNGKRNLPFPKAFDFGFYWVVNAPGLPPPDPDELPPPELYRNAPVVRALLTKAQKNEFLTYMDTHLSLEISDQGRSWQLVIPESPDCGYVDLVHHINQALTDTPAPRDRTIIRIEIIHEPADEEQSLAPDPIRTMPVVDAPNGNADRDLNFALTQRDWPLNREEALRYWEGKAATVIYQPPEILDGNWSELIDHTLRSLDKRFQNMRGDLTADVIDIFFLHWMANGRPTKAKLALSQLVEYRGVACTRDALNLHWRAVRDARSLRLRDEYLDAAIIDMDALRMRQPNLFGIEEPPPADYVFVYSPGFFVGRAVARDPFLAHYTSNILKLDPQHFSVAKRFARYLRGEWRLNADLYLRDGPRRYRTWGEHLIDAGIEIQERDKKHQSEFLDLIDRQLAQLNAIGGLREWIPELHRKKAADREWDQLARLYHPEDRKLLRNLPLRNKLGVFLSLRVHLPPPVSLDERMLHYAAGRAARRAQQESIRREAAVRKELKAQEGRSMPES